MLERTDIPGLRLRGFLFLSLLETHFLFIPLRAASEPAGAIVPLLWDVESHVVEFVVFLFALEEREDENLQWSSCGD